MGEPPVLRRARPSRWPRRPACGWRSTRTTRTTARSAASRGSSPASRGSSGPPRRSTSPAWGLLLCIGCWTEMGGTANVLRGIRHFGPQNRIVYVHFRDIAGTGSDFSECFVGSGDLDVTAAMRALKESGFTGAIIDDHAPAMVGDSRAGTSAPAATRPATSRGCCAPSPTWPRLRSPRSRPGAPLTHPVIPDSLGAAIFPAITREWGINPMAKLDGKVAIVTGAGGRHGSRDRGHLRARGRGGRRELLPVARRRRDDRGDGRRGWRAPARRPGGRPRRHRGARDGRQTLASFGQASTCWSTTPASPPTSPSPTSTS